MRDAFCGPAAARDASGRTLDEASECGFPAFAVPLAEQNPTVAPGPETYSTRKVAMERVLLEHALCPVTVLRPCAVHGAASRHAREWWFVKRLLDGRTAIPLAYGGRSRFQTTSAAAIADAVLHAMAGKLPPVANVCDADSPTVAEIGRAIMAVMNVQAELVGLPDAAVYPPKLGAAPWSIPRPMICSAAAAVETTYAEAVQPAVRWLVDHVDDRNWRERLPQRAAYRYDHFDYRADESALRQPGATQLAQ
jgi:nucleoside-diphosphate-sugar epimerase